MDIIQNSLARIDESEFDPSEAPLHLDNFVAAKDKADDGCPWCNEAENAFVGTENGIYGKPAVAINIPVGADVEVNFVPDLNTQGELTSDIPADDDTVQQDPFGLSVADPRDPQDPLADESGEGDETRYLSIQDLM